LLIDLGADLNKKNSSDMSPLMIACQIGSKEIVEYLIENKAEINEKANISGLTPLALCKDEELSLYLIKKGAKIHKRPASSLKK
jgi:ankyrin repeat protein